LIKKEVENLWFIKMGNETRKIKAVMVDTASALITLKGISETSARSEKSIANLFLPIILIILSCIMGKELIIRVKSN
jgi:hypothetical protein